MPFLLFALVVAFLVMLLFGGLEMDSAILTLFHAGDRPEIARLARIVTEIGGWRVLLPLTAAGALWLLWRRDWRGAVLLIATTISGRLLVELLKIWTDRLRPQAHEHLVAVESMSFPSGHAANATIVYLSLAILLFRDAPWRGPMLWAAVWLALASGISRVLLGVHWPSDVIAGWALGLIWTFVLIGPHGEGFGDGLRRAPTAGRRG